MNRRPVSVPEPCVLCGWPTLLPPTCIECDFSRCPEELRAARELYADRTVEPLYQDLGGEA